MVLTPKAGYSVPRIRRVNIAYHLSTLTWYICLLLFLMDDRGWCILHIIYRTCCWCDDVIKWKHVPRYWPFVRGIHRSPVNSPHKGRWRGALMLSLICIWINDCVNNRGAGDLRRHRGHYDVTAMNLVLMGYCDVQSAMERGWIIRHLNGYILETVTTFKHLFLIMFGSLRVWSVLAEQINIQTL